MEPDSTSSFYLDVSAYGIAAGFPQRTERRVLVAPSTGVEFNLIQTPLLTVGCSLVPDHQFEFDSSFILPNADKSFLQLVKLIKRMPDYPLTVFGHADPIGKDDYNKLLSGRRAMAVYAVLVRDAKLWEKELYSRLQGGDKWGTRSVQLMLNVVGYPPGNFEGTLDKETRDAVEAFQRKQELEPDRDPGPITRTRLFEVYMDFLCKDESGQPFKVEKTAFLGGGVDPDGKADYQGCGEHNPVLIFSGAEHKEFSKAENLPARNEANASNRRVIVYLFEKGTKIEPKRWPCPRVKEGTAGCKKRFWSNGEERRTKREQDKQRKFQESADTFACRFYHSLAAFSPCEAGLKLWVVRLKIDGPTEQILLAGRRYALTTGDHVQAPVMRGTTDKEGILRIPVFDNSATMTLKLEVSDYLTKKESKDSSEEKTSEDDKQTDATLAPRGENEAWEGEDKFMTFTLKGGALLPMDPPTAAATRQRLYNLGYGPSDPDNWEGTTMQDAIKTFQKDQGLEPTGDGDEQTRERIRQVHGS